MDKPDQAEKPTENQTDTSTTSSSKAKWQKIQSDSTQADDLLTEPLAGKPASTVEQSSPLGLEAPDISELEAKLLEAEKQANTYWNDKMRLAAEMQNMTRRHEKDLEKRSKFANEDFAKSLLAVMDSCVEGLKLDVDNSNANAKAMHHGLELIYQQLISVFEKYHIQEIAPLHQPFDPEAHQAMLAQPSDHPAGTVIEVVQKGYRLHERVLRPAMVIVAK